jgi:hypothetical protein
MGLLGWIVFHQHREVASLRDAAARAEAADDQIARLRRELAAARSVVPVREAAAPPVAVSDDVEKEPSPAPATVAVKRYPARDRLRARQSRLALLGRYGDLIAGLKLSPETQAKFEDLLVAKTLSRQDAMSAASQMGIPFGSADWFAAANAASAPDDLEIKALLGDDGYQSFTSLDEQHTLDSWKVMFGMSAANGSLVEAGVPMTPDQANSLAQIYHQVEANSPFSGVLALSASGSVDPVSGLSAGQQSIVDQASRVLTPDQVSTLRNYFVNVANPLSQPPK